MKQTKQQKTFYKTLEKIYEAANKKLPDNYGSEDCEALKFWTDIDQKLVDDGYEDEFTETWVQIYMDDDDFTKVIILDTPDHPFGQDTPYKIFDINDVDIVEKSVKAILEIFELELDEYTSDEIDQFNEENN